MKEATHKFDIGVMWEDGPWFIDENHECSSYGGKPCLHCHSQRVVTHKRHDGSEYKETKWICPTVIIVENEAGHNSTGLCLDCLLDAAKKVGIPRS